MVPLFSVLEKHIFGWIPSGRVLLFLLAPVDPFHFLSLVRSFTLIPIHIMNCTAVE